MHPIKKARGVFGLSLLSTVFAAILTVLNFVAMFYQGTAFYYFVSTTTIITLGFSTLMLVTISNEYLEEGIEDEAQDEPNHLVQ